ncbi:MAG: hypothetical protein WDW36_010197 [Sanguina aurantia]
MGPRWALRSVWRRASKGVWLGVVSDSQASSVLEGSRSHSSHTGALDHSAPSHRSSSSGTSTPSSSPSVSRSSACLLSRTSLDFKPLPPLPCHITRLNDAPPELPQRPAFAAARLPSLRDAFYEQGADIALSFSGITPCGPPTPSPASLTHTALASDKPVILATDDEFRLNSGVGISPALGLAPDPSTLPPPTLCLGRPATPLFPAMEQSLLERQEEAAHRERSSASRLRAEEAARTQHSQVVEHNNTQLAWEVITDAVRDVPPFSDGSPGTPAGLIQPGLLGAHEDLTAANLIASGTFGSVYRITLEEFPQMGQIAVKRVLLCDEAAVKKFAEEGCMAAQMSLAGGLQVFNMSIAPGPEEGTLYGLLYMQLGGISLEDVMKGMAKEHTRKTTAWVITPHISLHALNIADATTQLRDATTAMGYMVDCARDLSRAAKINIINGDVKPANVVLVNGEMKIIDFGLAGRRVPGELWSKHKGGTPDYLAPECMPGLYIGQLGRRSSSTDIVALAYILIQWLEYKIDGDWMCMIHALAAYCPRLPAMLQRMLLTDPNMRPSPKEIAAEFAQMHSVLLGASADTASSARYIVEQVGTAGSKAYECAAQLHSFTEFKESRDSLTMAFEDTDRPLASHHCLDHTWLLWDKVGCADQLPGYLTGMARLLMPWAAARRRVQPWLPFVEWAHKLMTGCKKGWIKRGETISLKEAWYMKGSTFGSQFLRGMQELRTREVQCSVLRV